MKTITAIIECPKGSGYKFGFDPTNNGFKLSKVMPAGMVFPFDFGFIPGTMGEDGDPLDVIVISEIPSFTGCIIDCRIIGAIKAQQTERNGETMRNDRFIAIPIVSQLFEGVHETEQLQKGMIGELEQFFKNYNEQAGKKFEVLERLDAAQSAELLP